MTSPNPNRSRPPTRGMVGNLLTLPVAPSDSQKPAQSQQQQRDGSLGLQLRQKQSYIGSFSLQSPSFVPRSPVMPAKFMNNFVGPKPDASARPQQPMAGVQLNFGNQNQIQQRQSPVPPPPGQVIGQQQQLQQTVTTHNHQQDSVPPHQQQSQSQQIKTHEPPQPTVPNFMVVPSIPNMPTVSGFQLSTNLNNFQRRATLPSNLNSNANSSLTQQQANHTQQNLQNQNFQNQNLQNQNQNLNAPQYSRAQPSPNASVSSNPPVQQQQNQNQTHNQVNNNPKTVIEATNSSGSVGPCSASNSNSTPNNLKQNSYNNTVTTVQTSSSESNQSQQQNSRPSRIPRPSSGSDIGVNSGGSRTVPIPPAPNNTDHVEAESGDNQALMRQLLSDLKTGVKQAEKCYDEKVLGFARCSKNTNASSVTHNESIEFKTTQASSSSSSSQHRNNSRNSSKKKENSNRNSNTAASTNNDHNSDQYLNLPPPPPTGPQNAARRASQRLNSANLSTELMNQYETQSQFSQVSSVNSTSNNYQRNSKKNSNQNHPSSGATQAGGSGTGVLNPQKSTSTGRGINMSRSPGRNQNTTNTNTVSNSNSRRRSKSNRSPSNGPSRVTTNSAKKGHANSYSSSGSTDHNVNGQSGNGIGGGGGNTNTNGANSYTTSTTNLNSRINSANHNSIYTDYHNNIINTLNSNLNLNQNSNLATNPIFICQNAPSSMRRESSLDRQSKRRIPMTKAAAELREQQDRERQEQQQLREQQQMIQNQIQISNNSNMNVNLSNVISSYNNNYTNQENSVNSNSSNLNSSKSTPISREKIRTITTPTDNNHQMNLNHNLQPNNIANYANQNNNCNSVSVGSNSNETVAPTQTVNHSSNHLNFQRPPLGQASIVTTPPPQAVTTTMGISSPQVYTLQNQNRDLTEKLKKSEQEMVIKDDKIIELQQLLTVKNEECDQYQKEKNSLRIELDTRVLEDKSSLLKLEHFTRENAELRKLLQVQSEEINGIRGAIEQERQEYENQIRILKERLQKNIQQQQQVQNQQGKLQNQSLSQQSQNISDYQNYQLPSKVLTQSQTGTLSHSPGQSLGGMHNYLPPVQEDLDEDNMGNSISNSNSDNFDNNNLNIGPGSDSAIGDSIIPAQATTTVPDSITTTPSESSPPPPSQATVNHNDINHINNDNTLSTALEEEELGDWVFVLQSGENTGQQNGNGNQNGTSDPSSNSNSSMSCYPESGLARSEALGIRVSTMGGTKQFGNQDDYLLAMQKNPIEICDDNDDHIDINNSNQKLSWIQRIQNEGYISLYGVFDGEGPNGHQITKIAKQKLAEQIFAHPLIFEEPTRVLKEAFGNVQKQLLELEKQEGLLTSTRGPGKGSDGSNSSQSSAAAAVALVLRLKGKDNPENAWIVLGYIGDSRIVLASREDNIPNSNSGTPGVTEVNNSDQQHLQLQPSFGAVALTKDHKCTVNKVEAARLQESNPDSYLLSENGLGQYNCSHLTRSLGAVNEREGVISDVEVRSYRLDPKKDILLLLGTKGLFMKYSNSVTVSKLISNGVGYLNQVVAEAYVENKGKEDVTAIAVSL